MNFSFVPPGGGGSAKFNVWAQNTQPEGYDGIWIQTAEKKPVKKIVFDSDVWGEGEFMTPPIIPLVPATTATNQNRYITFGMAAKNEYLYVFTLKSSSSTDYPTCATKYNFGTGEWTSLAAVSGTTENDRGELRTSIVSENMIYFLGSSNFIYMYNIDTNTWTKQIFQYSNSSGSSGIMYNSAVAFCGNNAYRFGTFIEKDYAVMDLSSMGYTKKTSMPSGNYRRSTTCTVGNLIYLFKNTTVPVLIYNASTDTFTSGANPPAVLSEGVAFHYDGDIYIQGVEPTGPTGAYSYILNAPQYPYIYHTETNTFSVWENSTVTNAFSSSVAYDDENGMIHVSDWNSLQIQSFSAEGKTYDENTVVIEMKELTMMANIQTSKKCERLPVWFSNVRYFTGGNLTSPAYAIGDGEAWNQIRE